MSSRNFPAASVLALALMVAAPPAVQARTPTPAAPTVAQEDRNPEAASGRGVHALAHADRHMVATANPLASEAGRKMLREGGSAIDAAIAAQLVLNLVEPQSSGIGGGAFLMLYSAGDQTLRSYDGRETAPASAGTDRFLKDGKPIPFEAAVNSGLSVGTPGLLRMLEMAHRRHGKLPWAKVFQPAIDLAEAGFPVSPRLHALTAGNRALARQPAAAAYFLQPDGSAWPVGHRLKNPAFAEVLRAVAAGGADAFHDGPIARDIVAAVRGHAVPGDLSEADLRGYQARERDPVCGRYRIYQVCGMAPPSSGGIAVLQMLGMLEQHALREQTPASLAAVHLFSEAGRLAYADRDRYVADPDFVNVPVQAMLAPAYVRARGALIRPDRSMGEAQAGDPAGLLAQRGVDATPELPSTSHLVVVDDDGNALSMTATIESEFGSKIFVRGFLLNNELTDFSLSGTDDAGRAAANRVEPGKRPRSSMAPTLVFRSGQPYMVVGSPGGSAIINYVAKTLVGVLDWNLDIQAAIDLPNFGSRNKATELEAGTSVAKLAPALKRMGHAVQVLPFPSGVHGIMIRRDGTLEGGADPRREGRALGD